jgi:16S rRNA (cytosine967-C5)-methyltransferase
LPRELALKVLLLSNEMKGAFASDVLDRELHGRRLSRNDASLATSIVYGTIRHRGTLDYIVERFCSRGSQRRPAAATPSKTPQRPEKAVRTLSPVLLNNARIGLYQLLFLEKVPAYAIVNEAVNLAKKRMGPGGAAFTNALLRETERIIAGRIGAEAASNCNPCRALPVSPTQWVCFREDVLPDPKMNIVRHISAAYSMPMWLVKRWLTEHGREKAVRLCRASNARPAISIRVNRLKTTTDALRECLVADGLVVRDAAVPFGLVLDSPGHFAGLRSFRNGLFQVQDEVPMRATMALDPGPDETVLDMCAGVGGKTTHMAETMNDLGLVVGADTARFRLARIPATCERLGLTSIHVVAQNGLWPAFSPAKPLFDAVIVDAPCSNTGVLARRAEARWRIQPKDFAELARLQLRLLLSAAELIKPQGRIVYSTCSIEKEENENVMKSFIYERPDFSAKFDDAAFPTEDGISGGFIARLSRRT